MKTKIWCVLLAVTLLLAGCSVNQAHIFGAMTYPGLDWLITPEEMMDALGKDAKEFTVDSVNNVAYRYESRDFPLFGEDALTQFTFYSTFANDGQPHIVLYTVGVFFDRTDPEVYREICDALIAEADRQGVAVEWEESMFLSFADEEGSGPSETVPIGTDPHAEGTTGYGYSFFLSSKATTADFPAKRGEYDEPLSQVRLFYRESAYWKPELYLWFEIPGYPDLIAVDD